MKPQEMEVVVKKCSTSYGKPPWIFQGSALYQLHLVRADTVREIIPKELKLVEAFGYTLGGYFLANYEDSPAGAFDELVIIAGIVWNPPTSCAWAARVLVSSLDACNHGRKDVGLPSQVAKFSKRVAPSPLQKTSRFSSFLGKFGIGDAKSNCTNNMDVQVTEIAYSPRTDLCNINIAIPVPWLKSDRWMGPEIKMSLPSFSGKTEHNPDLLKYSCSIQCRLRPVTPAIVSRPSPATEKDEEETSVSSCGNSLVQSSSAGVADDARNLSIAVMLSRPVLALEFSCLKMQVEAPVVVSPSDCRSWRTPVETS